MPTKAVIIEDWPASPFGDCLVQHLKIWGDRDTFIGETKGSAVMVEPRRFFAIIKSNFPMEQYFTRKEQIEPMKRRFHVILMKEENKGVIEAMRLDRSLLAEEPVKGLNCTFFVSDTQLHDSVFKKMMHILNDL
jgi:hypothetical protein